MLAKVGDEVTCCVAAEGRPEGVLVLAGRAAWPSKVREGGQGGASHPPIRYPHTRTTTHLLTHHALTYPPPTLHPKLITFTATGSLYESNYWCAVHHKGAGEPRVCVGGCLAPRGSRAGVFVHVLRVFQAPSRLPISPTVMFLSVRLFSVLFI